MKIGSSAKVYYSYFVSSNAGVDQSLENEIYIIIWLLQKLWEKWREVTDSKIVRKMMINDIWEHTATEYVAFVVQYNENDNKINIDHPSSLSYLYKKQQSSMYHLWEIIRVNYKKGAFWSEVTNWSTECTTFRERTIYHNYWIQYWIDIF